MYYYNNYKLFEKGSWLHKPVKTVIDLIPYFADRDSVRVLDFGSGVGRNSMPIAQAIRSKRSRYVQDCRVIRSKPNCGSCWIQANNNVILRSFCMGM